MRIARIVRERRTCPAAAAYGAAGAPPLVGEVLFGGVGVDGLRVDGVCFVLRFLPFEPFFLGFFTTILRVTTVALPAPSVALTRTKYVPRAEHVTEARPLELALQHRASCHGSRCARA